MKEFVFYYDVICPYAYLASRLIEGIAEKAGARVRWRPVLLGGIYKATKPNNEANTKAYEAMCPPKQLILLKDLVRLYSRHNVPCSAMNRMPDVNTLRAMRLLAACENETSEQRKQLTHQLYHALWAEKRDVSDVGVLQAEVKKIDWKVDVAAVANGDIPLGKNALFANTKEAVERGAFGVPSFWVNEKLYYGCDRLHFLERELGISNAAQHRILEEPLEPTKKRKLKIFHDFASPWCFIANRRIASFVESLKHTNIEVEWVPILLGGLFNAIGTPQVPILSAGENKRNYMTKDFHDWLHYCKIDDFTFPAGFPHKTITALRMTIANPDDKLRVAIYDAAWTKDVDLGDSKMLGKVVAEAGFDAEELLNTTKMQGVKDKLKANTDLAISLGCCGVPSFKVDDQPVIWGQDRLNIVADELCGWQDDTDGRIAGSKL